MALGSGGWRYQRRLKRRRWMLRLLVLAALAGGAAFAYGAGREVARAEISDLTAQIGRLAGESETLQARNESLAVSSEAASLEAAHWKKKYEAEVPTGKVQDVLIAVREKLKRGIPAERLTLLIQAADVPQKCNGAPASKRFLVRTPLYEGANDAVTFADNAVTVTATGEAALASEGKANAWFDPAKPVTVRFARLGGKTEEVSGVLPLHHSLVVNGEEMRVTLVRGEAQGFVRATTERCELPAALRR